jgi:hypothetical protein
MRSPLNASNVAYPNIVKTRTKSDGRPRYQCSDLSDVSRARGVLPAAIVVGGDVVHRKWEVVEVGEAACVEHWADVFPSWEDGVVCNEVVEVVCTKVNTMLLSRLRDNLQCAATCCAVERNATVAMNDFMLERYCGKVVGRSVGVGS